MRFESEFWRLLTGELSSLPGREQNQLTHEIAELELLDDVEVEDSNESEDTLGEAEGRFRFVSAGASTSEQGERRERRDEAASCNA